MKIADWLFGRSGELALGHSMLWRTDLVALHAIADTVIAVSFFTVSFGILWYLRHRPGMSREYRVIALLFCGFISAAAISQLLDIASVWYPVHGLEGVALAVTALLSATAVVLIWPLMPALAAAPTANEIAEVNERLRREAEAHEATLRELENARNELEARVVERTKELSLVKARFETALHGAAIYVFSQDRDLRYNWMYAPRGEDVAAGMIGRTDAELTHSAEYEAVAKAKWQVVKTGKPVDLEVSTAIPDRRGMFALHIDPTFGPDKSVDGIMCAAIDISRIRSLESEQRRLTEELGTALQRYETALRSSNVTVYTHDRELRYTSISNGMFGYAVNDIVGRRDADIASLQGNAPLAAFKHGILASGQGADFEFSVLDGGAERWYDTHVEPLRDITGEIVGLTCAAVDVTARKASEAHLRDLMRELTHRSKNLLAVIQGMARQTARYAGTTESFLDLFGARLQALAASHDLLVQESWHGASLSELVRSQLAHYLDGEHSQVSLEGPSLLLKPDAAQSLGLAVHELATNAAKYGALSGPNGRVSIVWRRLGESDADSVEIVWSEQGGPLVAAPQHRGFGSLVIERNLARSLDADASLTFPPEGALFRVVIPAANVASGR